MNMYDIIYKKREGGVLSREEISYFIEGYTGGTIPDYQAAALLMAIFFRKMDKEETYHLTMAMQRSGAVVDLSGIKGIKVDKHSTGGVGDKTTLVVAPLAASCGVPIAKMSGRGLGFTGGTVDKMEAIPGFKTTLEPEEFLDQVNRIGISVIGQTAHIAAADKKIYALRDVTATIDNMSLIASSIMSKKLASGSDAIVLDVKCGEGAFMETMEEALALGELMVEIGKSAGKKTIACITDMNQPLGRAVGNSLEVMEAIDTLKGKGPGDITDLSLSLAAYMIFAGEKAKTPEEGYEMAQDALNSGRALSKFSQFVSGQGGDSSVITDYTLFPKPKCTLEIHAEEAGYVGVLKAKEIGMASQMLGAGREKKEDGIDLSAGMVLNKKIGDRVALGETLAVLYGSDPESMRRGEQQVLSAFGISERKPELCSLIKRVIL